MRLVHKITSESYYGLSKILVELDPATRASEIPQLWDELRRKVLNIQPRLPTGASPVTVADDFGDVYGIYYGLSVDGGFTWAELRDWAQRIKTALVTVDGVQKVSLFGEQTPVVNVYVNLAALANFAIRPETIVATIGQQNTIVNSGEKQAGALQIQILEAGTYKGLDDISNQMLTAAFWQAIPPGRHRPRRTGLCRPAADAHARRRPPCRGHRHFNRGAGRRGENRGEDHPRA